MKQKYLLQNKKNNCYAWIGTSILFHPNGNVDRLLIPKSEEGKRHAYIKVEFYQLCDVSSSKNHVKLPSNWCRASIKQYHQTKGKLNRMLWK